MDSLSEKPLVSCIVIFLNGGHFLNEAIASVIAQKYEHWELILVNDGSTDISTKIAKKYSEKLPQKIRYLEHADRENMGMSASRNLGISSANGKYIAFLDADDIWKPNKLVDQVAIFERLQNVAMLYGRTMFWHSWSGKQEDVQRDSYTKCSREFDKVIYPPQQLILYLLDGGETYPCMCSVLIRRSIFDDIGAFEPEFRNANEDMVFHAKVFLNLPVYVASECWDYYRVHDDSYWQSAHLKVRPDNQQIERQRYLKWLNEYIKHNSISYPTLKYALAYSYFPYKYKNAYSVLKKMKVMVKRVNRSIKKALK